MQETCFSIADDYKVSNHCLRLGKPQQRKTGNDSKSYAPLTEDVRNLFNYTVEFVTRPIVQVLPKSLDIRSGCERWRWLALKHFSLNAHGKVYFMELTLWSLMQEFCLRSSLEHFLMKSLNDSRCGRILKTKGKLSNPALTWAMHDSSSVRLRRTMNATSDELIDRLEHEKQRRDRVH